MVPEIKRIYVSAWRRIEEDKKYLSREEKAQRIRQYRIEEQKRWDREEQYEDIATAEEMERQEQEEENKVEILDINLPQPEWVEIDDE